MKLANPSFTLAECLTVLEANRGLGVPIVDSENTLVGVLTDGDIRRFLINGRDLSERCLEAANTKFFYVEDPIEITSEHTSRYAFIPVLDDKKRVKEFIAPTLKKKVDANRVAGVVMAGCIGTRMRPLTNNLPKPLVELHGTSLIERILLRFAEAGITTVYVSVNYLAEKIMDTLGDGSRWGISIRYIHESNPLGTGGALGLLSNLEHDTLILTNGDIYSEIDFAKFCQFHENQKNDLTMATVQYSITIPFGVVLQSNGVFEKITEKPTHYYQCNSGIYVIDQSLIPLVPKGKFFNLPDLILKAQLNSRKIGVYEMTEYWADIGNITELEKNRQMLETLTAVRGEDA